MNPTFPAHSHISESCPVCIEHDKNEMAQVFRNVTARMRIAKAYGDPFIFVKEDTDLSNRTDMMAQWMDLITYHEGFDFEDVDLIAKEAA